MTRLLVPAVIALLLALPQLVDSNYIICIAVNACIFTVAAAPLNVGYAVVALGLVYALASWRIGVPLRAIKQNEVLARSQGISATGYKLLAFTVGAVLTGVAGGIYVFHLKIVDPLILDFYYMQAFL